MKEDMQGITIRLSRSEFAEAQRISAKRNISLNQTLRMLVGVGIECHKDMEKIGLIGVIDMAYYVKQAMASKATGKQLVLPL